MLRVVWSLGSRTCRRVDEFEERVEGSRSRDAKGRGAVSERSPQLACFFVRARSSGQSDTSDDYRGLSGANENGCGQLRSLLGRVIELSAGAVGLSVGTVDLAAGAVEWCACA